MRRFDSDPRLQSSTPYRVFRDITPRNLRNNHHESSNVESFESAKVESALRLLITRRGKIKTARLQARGLFLFLHRKTPDWRGDQEKYERIKSE
jgi:hypothetical protein